MRSTFARRMLALAAAGGCLALVPIGVLAQERLFVDAKVFTANPAQPYADAVAVRDAQIVAVGTRSEVAKALGAGAEIIDLAGKTLLPGLIDSHVHALWGGVTLLAADVRNEVHSIDELVKVAREAKRSRRGMRGDVLMVYGIPLDVWSHPAELNAAFSGGEFAAQPVFLQGMDGHTGWGNAALLKKARVDRAFISRLKAEQRKYYGYGADFSPNGFAVDAGLESIRRVVPEPDAAALVAGGAAAIAYLHSLGITSWLDPSTDAAQLGAYRTLAREHKLSAHVAALVVVRPDDPEPLKEALALRDEYRGVPGLTVPGVKVYADGVVEYPSQTAAMWAPYARTGKTGDLLFRPERFAALCVDADRRGLIVHTHAIGDRAVTETLNGIAAARQANGMSGVPHTITHLQFIRPSDQPRFHALGVIASYQLLWAGADTDTIELVQPYVDPAIYRWQYPARSLLDAGAIIAGASDWYVSSPNPFLAIYQAETRRGARGVLVADEDMPREAMLYAYTINAARAMGEDKTLGSIEPGKAADFALVDRDVLTVPPEQLRDAKIIGTMVAGQWVYRAL